MGVGALIVSSLCNSASTASPPVFVITTLMEPLFAASHFTCGYLYGAWKLTAHSCFLGRVLQRRACFQWGNILSHSTGRIRWRYKFQKVMRVTTHPLSVLSVLKAEKSKSTMWISNMCFFQMALNENLLPQLYFMRINVCDKCSSKWRIKIDPFLFCF